MGMFQMKVIGPPPSALFEVVTTQAHLGLSAAQLAETEFIFALTQDEVPVATGALKASGRVTPGLWDGSSYMTTIEYGGPDAPYALEVHENLEVHHENGKAKYVEDPANAESSTGRSAVRMGRALAASLVEAASMADSIPSIVLETV